MSVFALMCLLAVAAGAEIEPVSLRDYAAIRNAVTSPIRAPIRDAEFRDLWDQPRAYAGTAVRIQGRIARRFRQPGVAEFPALSELWVMDERRNPFCVLVPRDHDGGSEPGGAIRFAGVFLRMIRYQGSDGDRIAPLIVGPGPVETRDVSRTVPQPVSGAGSEGRLALVLGVFVVVILGFQHLRRPRRRVRIVDPAPPFQEG